MELDSQPIAYENEEVIDFGFYDENKKLKQNRIQAEMLSRLFLA